ncbi:MAG: hypothetical protein KBC84_02315 [Proteobacteria bacterium]|nr:hypothetical protein [Pseudomonadota bacterium]
MDKKSLILLLFYLVMPISAIAEDSTADKPNPEATATESPASEQATESPTPSPSESPLPEETTNETETSEANPSPSTSPTTSPTPIVHHEEVEPLEVWQKVHTGHEEAATPTPTATMTKTISAPVPTTTLRALSARIELIKAATSAGVKKIDKVSILEDKENVFVTPRQMFRLNRAKKMRRKILGSQEEFFNIPDRSIVDSRKEPEFRVCTVNLNGYSTRSDYQQLSLGTPAKLLKEEISVVNAILEADCTIVALQNISAVKPASMNKALKQLINRLKKHGDSDWNYYSGEYRDGFLRHAYLVKKGIIKVAKSQILYKLKLNIFGDFKLSNYPISPLKLDIVVPGHNNDKEKEFSLLNAFLCSNVSAKVNAKKDSLPSRMQIAEMTRKAIVYFNQTQGTEELDKAAILLVDRCAERLDGATSVLEGTLTLYDFTNSGKCKLGEKFKIECSSRPENPKSIFGVFGDNYFAPGHISSINHESKEPQHHRANDITSEIYLFAKDLYLAKIDEQPIAKYKSGYIDVANGLKNSPLVWTEINW